MKRLDSVLASSSPPVLSIYYTAGYPALNDTAVIARELADAGVGLIEIGIPFSDPVADGPVLQASNTQALKNGMTLSLLLNQIKDIRSSIKIPIILMGYLNPILQYGVETFCKESAEAGVDGIIIPDLPVEEYVAHYQQVFSENGLASIFLVSPTTSPERIQKIDSLSTGFIYAVSASSTTGVKSEFNEEQEKYFQRLKEMKLKNEFLIGFGISNRSTFDKACQYARGAIVGSAFVSFLRDTPDWNGRISEFVQAFR